MVLGMSGWGGDQEGGRHQGHDSEKKADGCGRISIDAAITQEQMKESGCRDVSFFGCITCTGRTKMRKFNFLSLDLEPNCSLVGGGVGEYKKFSYSCLYV